MAVPATNPRQPLYLSELMKRLGIEPAEGVIARLSLSYATAVRRCEACTSKEECRVWLDNAPQSVPFAPPFCPSNDILFELQADRSSLKRNPPPRVPDKVAKPHAHIADLKRLEEEIDEVLLCRAIDDAVSAELKRRRAHLLDEIACLRQQAATKRAQSDK